VEPHTDKDQGGEEEDPEKNAILDGRCFIREVPIIVYAVIVAEKIVVMVVALLERSYGPSWL